MRVVEVNCRILNGHYGGNQCCSLYRKRIREITERKSAISYLEKRTQIYTLYTGTHTHAAKQPRSLGPTYFVYSIQYKWNINGWIWTAQGRSLATNGPNDYGPELDFTTMQAGNHLA